jgi:hypothetical protein
MEKELDQQPPLVYGSPYNTDNTTYQPQIPSYTSPYDLSGQYQTGSPMEMKTPPFPSTSYQQSTSDSSPPPQQPEGEPSARFPSSRTFRDLPFFLLFILNLIGFFAIATTIGPPPPIHHYPSYPGNETYPPSSSDNYSTQQTMDRQDDYNHGKDKNDDEGEVLYGCFIAILTAILFSRVWFWALRNHPKGVTIISIVFSVLMVWVFALVLLAGGAILWGCIWVVIGLFEIAWCYIFRSRIAFAANVLECVGKVCTLFRGMQWLSFFMLIPITLWCLVWMHTFRRIALHFNRSEECTIPALLALYCLFSFYWVSIALSQLLPLLSFHVLTVLLPLLLFLLLLFLPSLRSHKCS